MTLTCLQSQNKTKPMYSEVFDLKMGDSVQLQDESITIKFLDVAEDSRCPKGATCIWEGNARIILRISRQDTSLNTAFKPKIMNYMKYQIKLIEVKPYPRVDRKIKQEDYLIKLNITK